MWLQLASTVSFHGITLRLFKLRDSCTFYLVYNDVFGCFVSGYPEQRPGSSHTGFVVDKVALGQVVSEYFGFPSHLSIHRLLHIHHHHQHPSSGAGVVGQMVADVPSGLSLAPPPRN
jgi:hypothetical protein